MNFENVDWSAMFANWFPMLVIFAGWILFLIRLRRGPYSKYQKDSFELQLRQTEALERLAAAIEKRG